MHPTAFPQPVNVSPLIRFGRYSMLLAGIGYGAFWYRRYTNKELALKDVKAREKAARDARLAQEKAIRSADDFVIVPDSVTEENDNGNGGVYKSCPEVTPGADPENSSPLTTGPKNNFSSSPEEGPIQVTISRNELENGVNLNNSKINITDSVSDNSRLDETHSVKDISKKFVEKRNSVNNNIDGSLSSKEIIINEIRESLSSNVKSYSKHEDHSKFISLSNTIFDNPDMIIEKVETDTVADKLLIENKNKTKDDPFHGYVIPPVDEVVESQAESSEIYSIPEYVYTMLLNLFTTK